MISKFQIWISVCGDELGCFFLGRSRRRERSAINAWNGWRGRAYRESEATYLRRGENELPNTSLEQI